MYHHLEGQIMREFRLLQKKIIFYFFYSTRRQKNVNVAKKAEKSSEADVVPSKP